VATITTYRAALRVRLRYALGSLSREAVLAGGGEVAQPIGADAPEITARFRDPAGNVLGLYQQPT
jgi:hypothetical protein